MIIAGGSDNVEKVKKTDGIKKPLQFHKSFLQKNFNRSYFSIGCMKWQLVVVLESIWETDSIIILFPA